MFRRDIFALVAVALIGSVLTVYLAIGQTPFFPKSLETLSGDCPVRAFIPAHRRPVMDPFEADWFASELLGLHEASLIPAKDGDRQSVRVTVLRSFHAPVTVRTIEMEDGRLRLVAKLGAGRDGCPDPAGCVVDRVLTETERAGLSPIQARLIRKAPHGCDGGPDGSRWIAEASGRGDYRFWSEWTPEDGDLHAMGMAMLDLTGWRFRELY